MREAASTVASVMLEPWVLISKVEVAVTNAGLVASQAMQVDLAAFAKNSIVAAGNTVSMFIAALMVVLLITGISLNMEMSIRKGLLSSLGVLSSGVSPKC